MLAVGCRFWLVAAVVGPLLHADCADSGPRLVKVRGSESSPANTPLRHSERSVISDEDATTRKHMMSVSAAPKGWEDALPTGNGEIGALVFANLSSETIRLTHHDLLIRSKKPNLPDVSQHFPKVRELIADQMYKEAYELIQKKIMDDYDFRGLDSFHPAFDIKVKMHDEDPSSATDVRRVVNFETGEVIVSWKQGGVKYQRKIFVSRRDSVVVMQITASKPGKLNCDIGLWPTDLRPEELGDGKDIRIPRFSKDRIKAKISLDTTPITFQLGTERDNLLTLLAEYDRGGSYAMIGGEYGGAVRVIAQAGQSYVSKFKFHAKGANELLVLCGIFANSPSKTSLHKLQKELTTLTPNYALLLKRHAAVHREMFLRTTVNLEAEEQYRAMSNQELLAAIKEDRGGKALIERQCDFGRYALICSCNPLSMPAHLKGIWTGVYAPAWAADIHNDINIQMTYYQALPGNMPELMISYFNYYDSMIKDYQTNAKHIFGCRGMVAPISQTTHGLSYYASFWMWTGGAPWIAQLYNDYWLYEGDRGFLRDRAIPFMKEVALFYEDFLIEGEDGKLLFSPGYSPENHPKNLRSGLTTSSTMDVALARELLTNLCDGCQLLDIEREGVQRWRKMVAKLPEYRINNKGAVAEWMDPDLEDNYKHRHLCHLYPAYPGMEVTTERADPELYRAFRTALDLKNMPSQCNFTFPLIASCYARFEDGDLALECAEGIAKVGYVFPNLMTRVGGPWPVVQVDAAYGITACVLDMLLYSEPGMVKLLPALPEKWATGSVHGMKCRGGGAVDIDWDMPNNRLEATIVSPKAQTITVKFPAVPSSIELEGADAKISSSSYGNAYRQLSLPENHKLTLSVNF